MRKNTEKRAAFLCAAAVIGFALLYIAVIVGASMSEHFGSVAAIVVVVLFLAMLAAIIVGLAAALRQRLREIDRGEEEDARQY